MKHLRCGMIGMLLLGAASTAWPQSISLQLLGRYTTGLADIAEEVSSGETVALRGDKMYVTNANDVSLDIVDVSDPAAPRLLRRVDLKAYGSSINSVDVSSKNLIAVAVDAFKKTDPGTVLFLTPGGQVIRTAKVGAGPDMLVFTRDGKRLLVANEGEPDCYGPGCTDPAGSVSVIDVIPMKPNLPVHTIGFEDLASLPAGVRIFGPGATPAQDLEPEYIAVSDDGGTAWVSLQENNAIAKLDLQTLTVVEIFALGFKDHGRNLQGLDASDRDGAINIRPWSNLLGMYQPDAIAQFRLGDQTYLATANEGDARAYPGFAEETRGRQLAAAQPVGSPFKAIPGISNDRELGRLTLTNTPPGGDWTNAYVFGGRSFSILNADTGQQVWDSGDDFEWRTAAALAASFNSNNTANTFDDRSDNKGPEPEGVAVGKVGGRTYLFVGLERVGGVLVYDVSYPLAPVFQTYFVTRDFSTAAVGLDSGPEILRFIEPQDSPSGAPMLVIANEITGTVTLVSLSAN